MLGYKETMVLLDEMRPHYDEGFTSSERSTIEELYNKVCKKPIRRSGCSDCYRDAYIELVTTLKRLGKMPKTSLYVLKAGALLHEFGSSDFYTLDNIPADFADRWLGKHPEDIKLFQSYPSNWEERAKAALAGTEIPADDDDADKDTDKDKTGTEIPAETEAEKPAPRRGRPSTK